MLANAMSKVAHSMEFKDYSITKRQNAIKNLPHLKTNIYINIFVLKNMYNNNSIYIFIDSGKSNYILYL